MKSVSHDYFFNDFGIKGIRAGTDLKDAVNVSQLNSATRIHRQTVSFIEPTSPQTRTFIYCDEAVKVLVAYIGMSSDESGEKVAFSIGYTDNLHMTSNTLASTDQIGSGYVTTLTINRDVAAGNFIVVDLDQVLGTVYEAHITLLYTYQVTPTFTARFSGTGHLFAQADPIFYPSGIFSMSGDMSGVGEQLKKQALFNASGSLSGIPSIIKTFDGASFSASGSLSGILERWHLYASFDASGTLSGVGTVIHSGQGLFAGTGTLSGGADAPAQNIVFQGSGSMSGGGEVFSPQQITFDMTGTLSGAPAKIHSASITLLGSGGFTGNPDV